MINSSLLKEFTDLPGRENVFTDKAGLVTYSYDATVLDTVVPAVILRPAKYGLVGKIVDLCNENSVPVTVRGAGTNLSGGTIPSANGVVMATNALNNILEINEEDMYAVVHPGVITAKPAAAVEAKGLFYLPIRRARPYRPSEGMLPKMQADCGDSSTE